MTWPQIKARMRVMGFKKVSESDSEREFRGLFVKNDKVCVVRKVKRGKLIFASWLNWTNIEETETLVNETYYLEERACEHERVVVKV